MPETREPGGGSEPNLGIPVNVDPSLAAIPDGVMLDYPSVDFTTTDEFIRQRTRHLCWGYATILETAETALRRTDSDDSREAIILGAGPGRDLPLAHLANMFDLVRVVDLNPNDTEMALSDLTPAQLGKISLIGADVTGLVADFATRTQAMSEQHTSYDAFIAAATPLISSFDPTDKQPAFGREHTFVCSHLLLSQLMLAPRDFLGDIVAERYGKELFDGPYDKEAQPIHVALDGLDSGIQKAHIDYLARLVRQTGTVHFADSYDELVGDPRAPRSLSMISQDVVDLAIEEHFSRLIPSSEWQWAYTPDVTYRVIFESLAPREHSSSVT